MAVGYGYGYIFRVSTGPRSALGFRVRAADASCRPAPRVRAFEHISLALAPHPIGRLAGTVPAHGLLVLAASLYYYVQVAATAQCTRPLSCCTVHEGMR